MITPNFKRWTLDELRTLRTLIESGQTIEHCVKTLNRTRSSINNAIKTYKLPKFDSKTRLQEIIGKEMEQYKVKNTTVKVIAKKPNVFEPVLTAPKATTESTGSLVELLIKSAKEKNLKVTITFESYPHD
jgi:type II secretory pathway component PulF